MATVLLASFVLRVWGGSHGLPFAYNADEHGNFVGRAVALFGDGWNPGYFVNPPGFTYVLHVVYAAWFGGADGARAAYTEDPSEALLIGRVIAALCGTLAVGLLYLAGARLMERRVALLAAALMGVAFLPVFYSHLALNDVPELAMICVALWGIAGIVRDGRLGDYAVAGLGIGLACATKYTGGVVVAALLGAAAVQLTALAPRRAVARGVAVAAGRAIVGFLAANPFALLDFGQFRADLGFQSNTSSARKLGQTEHSGFRYYLWTATWGLGYIPIVAAMSGALSLGRRNRRLLVVLAPAPLLFVLFMGGQERFFGRWLLPIFPILCLLAAYGGLQLADAASRRRPRLRPAVITCVAAAILGQGLVQSLHVDRVLSRHDTRALAFAWLTRHLPRDAKVVVEPIVPEPWLEKIGKTWPMPRSSELESYQRELSPELVDRYIASGYCWVVVGSTQRGRAEVQPTQVPGALDYYRTLERGARVAFSVSPYHKGSGPVTFNFDWSFDYYPRAYRRPGPHVTVYELHGGRCSTGRI